jgi:uncharacterized lipoprotein YmbA
MLRSASATRLSDRMFSPFSCGWLRIEPARPTTDKIVVDILEFSSDASGKIHLDASWSLLSPNSHESVQSRLERLSEPADANDTADQVRAMSAAVDGLASRIAQNLASRVMASPAR